MKKKLNYFLLCCAIGLWGAAGYRVVKRWQVADQISAYSKPRNQPVLSIPQKKDLALTPMDRDPFSGNSLSVKSYASKRPIRISPTPKQVGKAPTIWPSIKYYGFIKSQEKKQLLLVKVGNTLHRVHAGQTIGDIVVEKVFKDSIRVAFQKEKRTFRLE